MRGTYKEILWEIEVSCCHYGCPMRDEPPSSLLGMSIAPIWAIIKVISFHPANEWQKEGLTLGDSSEPEPIL